MYINLKTGRVRAKFKVDLKSMLKIHFLLAKLLLLMLSTSFSKISANYYFFLRCFYQCFCKACTFLPSGLCSFFH